MLIKAIVLERKREEVMIDRQERYHVGVLKIKTDEFRVFVRYPLSAPG